MTKNNNLFPWEDEPTTCGAHCKDPHIFSVLFRNFFLKSKGGVENYFVFLECRQQKGYPSCHIFCPFF